MLASCSVTDTMVVTLTGPSRCTVEPFQCKFQEKEHEKEQWRSQQGLDPPTTPMPRSSLEAEDVLRHRICPTGDMKRAQETGSGPGLFCNSAPVGITTSSPRSPRRMFDGLTFADLAFNDPSDPSAPRWV